MLAAFAGWVIIGNVPAILHTPLMSGSNFVHGIVVVGGLFALFNASTPLEQGIGFFAVLLGAGNAAGGYAVTDRMLGHVQDQRRQTQARPRSRSRPGPSPEEEELRPRHAHPDLSTRHRRSRSLRGLPLHVRPEADVVAGDGAVGDPRRRDRHGRRCCWRASSISSPSTPRRGPTCWSTSAWPWPPLLIGGAGAWFVGRKVAMTAMPQMVAIYNGMGGGAAGVNRRGGAVRRPHARRRPSWW